MDDVAIIGVGLHPFGRHGDKSAFEMGADAVELALTDAGVPWSDVQSAFGGSWAVSTDPITSLVGLTGLPFTNVFSACRDRCRHDPTGHKRHPRRHGRHRHGHRHGQASSGFI